MRVTNPNQIRFGFVSANRRSNRFVAIVKIKHAFSFSLYLIQLTTREVTFRDYGRYKFIEKLKNAPALKHLIMDDLKVSVQDMETVHAYCPKLSVLKIKHGLGNINQVPPNIKPVSSTKTPFFEFAYQASVDSIIKWFKYVRQKYNRVTHLKLNSIYEYHRFEDKDAAQIAKDGFKSLLKDFAPCLVFFDIQFLSLDSTFFDEYLPKRTPLKTLNGYSIADKFILKAPPLPSAFKHLRHVTLLDEPEFGEADVEEILDDMSPSVLKKIRNLMKQFHGEENAFKDLLERRKAEMEE